MDPLPFNTRWHLELERNALIADQKEHDLNYGSYVYSYVTTAEVISFLCYLFIIVILASVKKLRTMISAVISIWAFLNAVVLARLLAVNLLGYDCSTDIMRLSLMLASVARAYAACLYVAWFCTKFCKPWKSDIPKYFLMTIPLMVFTIFVNYYFLMTEYVYEVFGPGCDIVSWTVYGVVTLLCICNMISQEKRHKSSQMALLISIISLITTFPLSMQTIFVRFALDISWTYRFHISFVDVGIHIVSISSSVLALFVIFLTSKGARSCLRGVSAVAPEVETVQVKEKSDSVYYIS